MCTKFVFLLLPFMVLSTNSGAAKIYKWVDENGVTHFSEKPVSRSANRVQLESLNGYVPAPEGLPGESASAPAQSTPKIIMYGTAWCGFCKKARNYFRAKGVSYTEFDIEKSQKARREYKKMGGTGSVPLFTVDDTTIRGFSASRFEKLLAER